MEAKGYMAGSILTVAEIKELTGCRQRARCIRQLVAQDVPFVIAADGWPRVLRDALMPKNVTSMRDAKHEEPDWDALDT